MSLRAIFLLNLLLSLGILIGCASTSEINPQPAPEPSPPVVTEPAPPPPPAPPPKTQPQPQPEPTRPDKPSSNFTDDRRVEAERRAEMERRARMQREAERRAEMQRRMEEQRRLESEKQKAQAAQYESPRQFPWPPAKPSSFTKLPLTLFGLEEVSSVPLKVLDNKIRLALERGGYYDASYYTIPGQSNAYALVTRLERFNLDGAQVDASDRWVSNLEKSSEFNLGNYLKSLFFSDKGYYRIIVFVVTEEDLPSWSKPARAKKAEQWIVQGSPSLAKSVQSQALTSDHNVLALVYEFEKNCDDCENRTEGAITQNIPGRLPTKEHLSMTSIWNDDL